MQIGTDLPELPSFGRYQPLFRIAAGGMAEVYGARAVGEAGFHRWVALKRILPHLSDDARFVEMFLDEARLAANVQSMHVVPTLDLGRASDGSLYLVMDLVVGVTLGTLVAGASRTGDLLPVPLVVEILAQAAQGLHDAHEARSPEGEPLHIVHRDVSPRNILVGLDGRARILDFGIAQGELRATMTAVGEIKGTQAYLSPEQAAMKKLDRRSDVYALGIVAWEALLGQRLFRGEALGERRHDVPRVDSIRKALSPALADIVARALSPDREQRQQTADELAIALRATAGPAWTDASTNEVSRAVRQYGAATIERIQLGMQRSSPERTSAPPEPPSPKQTTSRLRAYGTSFVGREGDLDELEKILAGPDRLVTLFGPGGMGKTRLAIELAQRVRERFPGGVVFADVTEARTAEGICYVVGSALGVPTIRGGEASAAIDMLGGVLAARGRALVILDNVEQAMAHVGATLGAWVLDAPAVTFLVTSRERLRLEAETVYELAPLDLGTDVGGSAAARLFIDRATKVRRDLRVDAEAERAIAAIVKRLDGLPLAIELAASRVRVIDVVQLAAQLSERLRVPTRGARDASPRQATLDAAIRWSWDLLEPEEQVLFASLSVFRGGFDARAACEIGAPGSDPEIVEQLLEQLADKSLVRFGGGTRPRFSMLESIREFAARELAQRGATEATMERYAGYYGALAALWDDPRTAARPSDIERDLDNLVNAFTWTVEHRKGDEREVHRLLLLALATEPVLGVRGPVSLARQLLEQAVAVCDGLEAEADLDARARLGLARALITAGSHGEASAVLAEARLVASFAPGSRAKGWVALTEAEHHWARGNLKDVITASARAVQAGEEAGDLLLLARAHFRHGSVLLLRGEHEAAKEALESARMIARALRFEQMEARIDVTLAEVAADLGDETGAARIAANARALASRIGDRWLEAYALMTLSSLALDRDDPRESLALLTRAMQLTREAGHLRAEGLFLCFVGVSEECAGLVPEARATFEAAAEANRRTGNRLGEGLAHAYRGRLLARLGEIEAAEAALATGASILEEVGDGIRVVVARLCAGHVDLARAEAASLTGDRATSELHRERARHVAASTREELLTGRLRSTDVMHALRMLENDLETHHDSSPPGARDTVPPDPPEPG